MSRCAYPKCSLSKGHEGRHRAVAATIAVEAMGGTWNPTHRDLIELWISIAHQLGWLTYCTFDSRTDHWGADSGFPDLLMTKDGHTYAIEVKVPPDDVTDEQRAWLDRLGAVPGITEGVFRSSGSRVRDMDVIADILSASPPVLP